MQPFLLIVCTDLIVTGFHYLNNSRVQSDSPEFPAYSQVLQLLCPIVTAAVHWGFSSSRKAFPLTFQHRAGVSPYTSTFVLAETCVFGKQFHGFFCCSPAATSLKVRSFRNIAAGRTLSLSYGRCIAEFLDEESLVHLGLLALSTCVGLRYGRCIP